MRLRGKTRQKHIVRLIASAGTAEGVGLTGAAKSLYGYEKDSSARERDGSRNDILVPCTTLR